MKLKRFEIMDILDKLESFKGEQNKYFVYHVSKIKTSLEAERKAIIEMSKPSDEYIQFERERQSIILKFSEKNEKGLPVEVNQRYKIQQNKELECQEAINEIINKYKEAIDRRKKEINELERILEEYVEVDIPLIPFAHLPDFVEQSVIDILFPIIDMKEKE